MENPNGESDDENRCILQDQQDEEVSVSLFIRTPVLLIGWLVSIESSYGYHLPRLLTRC